MSNAPSHTQELRVRYSETDQMGTFSNGRALDWFECGRTELMRGLGLPYTEVERRGFFLPVVEAHVEYRGRARYDDLLRMVTTATMVGRVRVRFDVDIAQAATGAPVARGWTVHAFVNPEGRPVRAPGFITELLAKNESC